MYIHLFGAYWGLAATFMMNPTNIRAKMPYKSMGASYSSDTFSMIGTLFLWLFWPSFNGALALHDVQARVYLNTIISLTGSCMITFALSAILRHDGKFCMEDIQNATLAGGVAIGASADLYVTPGGALMVGAFAGFVSVVGFNRLSPFLLQRFGLHDSCGINNLHGMTGFLGAIVSAIVTGIATPQQYGPIFDELLPRGASGDQWKYQLACLGHSLGISLVGGLIFGFITDKMKGLCQPHKDDAFMFDDRHAFEVPESQRSDDDIEMSQKPHD
jgi:ammonium transporter Rh